MEDLNICQKSNKHGQSMFCEAVKVDMETSKKYTFHKTITSTLSLITVLFEGYLSNHLTQGIQWCKRVARTINLITE
jgi:hypothetical protein